MRPAVTQPGRLKQCEAAAPGAKGEGSRRIREQQGSDKGFIQSCRPLLNHEVPGNSRQRHQGLQGWQAVEQHGND
uniref:Uncharacterized protein n=1 Tax=Nitrosospira multiformis TaxID=1231 RepID=O05464_9PROT|nr:unknown [Nitrosospira multiformis ATCC 25196]